MTKPILGVSKTNIDKVREKRVDRHHLTSGLSRKQELRFTARVKMPLSSPGYVLDLSKALEFNVIETRIDARNSGQRLENPVSIAQPRYKIRERQTGPFYAIRAS